MEKIKIIGKSVPNIPYEEKPAGYTDPVWRYSRNPVIDRNPAPDIGRIFNSAVIPYQGEFIGVFRTAERTHCDFLRVGHSKDGVNFTFEENRIDLRNADGTPSDAVVQYDPRLVELEGAYYVIWCDVKWGYPALGVAVTKDFRVFTRLDEPVLPATRNGVLFPRRIDGKYLFLSRPCDMGHTPYGDVFVSYSKDLEYWGKHKPLLMKHPEMCWQALKIGAGPAPIETSEGWLLFYHGVISTCSGYVYSMGGALLDINDPTKVLYNCKFPLLTPEKPYETTGFVPNVVFPVATINDAETGRIAIYYGGADTFTNLAFTEVNEVVNYIKKYTAKL